MKKLIKKKNVTRKSEFTIFHSQILKTRLAQFTCYSTGNLWLMKIECLVSLCTHGGVCDGKIRT